MRTTLTQLVDKYGVSVGNPQENYSMSAYYLRCSLSIVIPVYRPNFRLKQLLEEFSTHFDRTEGGLEFVIVLDNDSPDFLDDLKRIALSSSRSGQFKLIQLVQNVGQSVATWVGICESRGSIVVTINDDSEHSPSQAKFLIDALRDSSTAQAVIGCGQKRSENTLSGITSKAMQVIQSIVQGVPWGFRTSSLMAFSQSAVTEARLLKEREIYPGWAISKFTCEFLGVTFRDELQASRYNFRSRFREFARFIRFFGASWGALFIVAPITIVALSIGGLSAALYISLGCAVAVLHLRTGILKSRTYDQLKKW